MRLHLVRIAVIVSLATLASIQSFGETRAALNRKLTNLEKERESQGIYNADDVATNQRRAELTKEIDAIEDQILSIDDPENGSQIAHRSKKRPPIPSVIVNSSDSPGFGTTVPTAPGTPITSPTPVSSETFSFVGGILMFFLGVAVYFVPIFVARHRHCKSFNGIAIVNVFLGWTFVGWVGALAWAASGAQTQVEEEGVSSLSIL